MKCLILISAPGAGKGTVSDYIKSKYDVDHISTGNLLRKKALEDTNSSKYIKGILDKGLLVDDDTLISVLEEKLKDQKKDFILDGTPRVLNQAILLEDLFKKYNIILDKVLFINIDYNIALERIKKRRICENCGSIYNSYEIDKCEKCGGNLIKRSDDNEEVYYNRYKKFQNTTFKLLDYYKNKLITINNNHDMSYLYKEIDELFKGDDFNDNN